MAGSVRYTWKKSAGESALIGRFHGVDILIVAKQHGYCKGKDNTSQQFFFFSEGRKLFGV